MEQEVSFSSDLRHCLSRASLTTFPPCHRHLTPHHCYGTSSFSFGASFQVWIALSVVSQSFRGVRVPNACVQLVSTTEYPPFPWSVQGPFQFPA